MNEIEEKAEKYLKENCCEMCMLADDCKADTVNCFSKDCYIKGYAQGQQELMASNEIIKRGFADNLEKENAELSKALEESEQREKELCILAENLKAELKKIRCAYITEKVGNLCNGVDTDNLFKSAE